MRSPRIQRLGVTLLELLVVLILMALSAAVVLPALLPPSTVSMDPPGAAALAHARRSAIRRGESMRFQLSVDGAWALASVHDGNAVDSGRVLSRGLNGDTIVALNVLINSLGTCLPVAADGASASFDPLACVWRPMDAP